MKKNICEFHEIIRSGSTGEPFTEQLSSIISTIRKHSEGRVLHFCRLFLSDAGNQEAQARSAASCLGCPVSIVQQAPLDGSKIAAWCYWTDREFSGNFQHRFHCSIRSEAEGSLNQTEDIFRKYQALLDTDGQSIRDNCIRTWLFVRDVDTNYAGVVKGRKNEFDRIGLTAQTHYIASTGIQGSTGNWHELVQMDAYSVGGLMPNQVRYIQATSHLNPTYEYGVTFERATSVDYSDRRHIFVSGTASIDNKGEIVHTGDIKGQTMRMMENIEALLHQAGAGLKDIKAAIVYLRDTADYATVKDMFSENWPWLDPIIVLAPVCRPGWLIETECIACIGADNPQFKDI